MKQKPFWFLFNIYGWLIVIMSIITAIIIQVWWIVLMGVIGYQFVLLIEMTLGRDMGRSGAVRLARAEQENRELRAEQARLLGAIRERDEKIKTGCKDQVNQASDDEKIPSQLPDTD